MIEAVVWVVVFLLLAGCAYLVIRTTAQWVRRARENRWMKQYFHEWAGSPTVLEVFSRQDIAPIESRTMPNARYMFHGKEVHPWDWKRRVKDFEKEHWSATAEREIRARRKPGAINYYDKKEEVPDGGTRGEKSSGNGADTD